MHCVSASVLPDRALYKSDTGCAYSQNTGRPEIARIRLPRTLSHTHLSDASHLIVCARLHRRRRCSPSFRGRQSLACLALWSLMCCCLVVSAVCVCVCARAKVSPARACGHVRETSMTPQHVQNERARAERAHSKQIDHQDGTATAVSARTLHHGMPAPSSAERARRRGMATHAALVGFLAEFLRDTALGVLSHVHCVSRERRAHRAFSADDAWLAESLWPQIKTK